MNTKWKVVSSVMLLIAAICIVFGILVQQQQEAKMAGMIAGKRESAALLADTLLSELSKKYQKRIVAFTNPDASQSRREMIQAFADHNREKLLFYSSKLFKVLKKGDPDFSTIGWILPDNYVFLRTHDSQKFGDYVGDLRSDIAAVNESLGKKAVSGFHGGHWSLQYRIVQPVFLDGEYLGVLQFGINANFVVNSLREHLGTIAGMKVLNENFKKKQEGHETRFVDDTHMVCTPDVPVFDFENTDIDWSKKQQQVLLSGRPYVLLNIMPLLSFKNEELGHFFVAIDLSEEIAHQRALFFTVLLLSIFVLFTSFIILYFSYGALIEKIFTLNATLEKNNVELESKVADRTSRLQESEQRLQRILDHAPVGILIADAASRQFQYANPAVCALLGYAKEELEGETLQLIHSPQKLAHAIKEFSEIQQGERKVSPDIPFVRKDGTEFKADVISASLELEGKLCVVGFVVDQTQSRILTKQLHRAQKMEAVGLMAGGVAHDLNNILSGVVSYPELLLMKLPPDSEMRDSLLAIQKSGKRAAAVVADLLTVARGVASTRELHDVNNIILEYLESPECEKLKSYHPLIVCRSRLDAEKAFISCSVVHIQKTIMNLMNNAVEAVGDMGSVTVSTRNCQIDTLEDSRQSLPSGDCVCITVEDDGPGIADTDLEHIFEPFYTKKKLGRSGTGLGLSVVWNTVQDHDGTISVVSSDKGTCFKLCFPVDPGGKVDSVDSAVSDICLGNGETILVVDDEPQLRDIASQMLSGLGYKVASACSGELAIKFLQDNVIDLVIIDMLMEPGMNGRQAYERMLEINPEQKAIIASGFSESEDVEATLQMGAGGFIKKPYSMSQLGKIVMDVLTA